MLKRSFLAAALSGLAILATPFTAAEARSLDEILSEGVVRIGINPNFPNMSARNDAGEWVGFDIDIGTELANGLGVEVEWVPTETAQRVPFLVSDRIDIALGALTRNPERAMLIDFTVPFAVCVILFTVNLSALGEKLKRSHARELTLGLSRDTNDIHRDYVF